MARINPFAHFDLVKPLNTFAAAAEQGIDPTLAELVKIRASQINGCAMCLHMHTRDAIQQGEDPVRIFVLEAWRESPLFTAAERAALAWTEVLTTVSAARAPDDVYAGLAAHFSAEQQVKITLLVGAINAYNRLNVGFEVQHPAADRKAA